ncbi:hypothetical protein LINGRAPRIM_LOCUS471 [Linum grandiflorum]
MHPWDLVAQTESGASTVRHGPADSDVERSRGRDHGVVGDHYAQHRSDRFADAAVRDDLGAAFRSCHIVRGDGGPRVVALP